MNAMLCVMLKTVITIMETVKYVSEIATKLRLIIINAIQSVM